MALFIKKHEPEEISIENKSLGFYFDKKTGIGVIKKYVDMELEVGAVYDFTFEDETDCDTYQYLVLKAEKNNIYYLTEYYGHILTHKESLLGDAWQKCDVKEELGIDLEQWLHAEIDYE